MTTRGLALWQHAPTIWRGALADLRHRYAGSGLGVVWNLLEPLAQIVVYSLVFSKLVGEAIPGISYALWLCVGIVPWLGFAETVRRGASAFTDNAVYLKKLAVPEGVWLARTVLSATLGLAIALAILVPVGLLLGAAPRASWLVVPAVVVLLQLFGAGLALLLATVQVFFRDVTQLVGILLLVWFWATPIVWLQQQLPADLVALVAYNPMAWFVDALRVCVFDGGLPGLAAWAKMAVAAVLALTLGRFAFVKLQPEIRDLL